MAKVIYTKPATYELQKIRKYIEKDNKLAAGNLVDAIRDRCRTYATNPNIGRTSDAYGANVRSFPYGSYVVFYQPIKDGIAVLHVFHGARDLPAAFRSEEEDP